MVLLAKNEEDLRSMLKRFRKFITRKGKAWRNRKWFSKREEKKKKKREWRGERKVEEAKKIKYLGYIM